LVLTHDHSSGEVFSPDSRFVGEVRPSPNQGERRGFAAPDSIVLHYTGMTSAAAAVSLLRDPNAEVSSHYVVYETGGIAQLVPEVRRAWHAGVSCWRGERDMNSASIGIEICNAGHDGGLPPFPDRQIEAVIALCRDIAERRLIRPERILAHSDIAPARKRDPGEAFPWGALGHAGVGHWVEAAAPSSPLFSRGEDGTPVRGLRSQCERRLRRAHGNCCGRLSTSLPPGASRWRCRLQHGAGASRSHLGAGAEDRMTKRYQRVHVNWR
jgi:N-acetylmuramoyl-L-alanine amidase